MCEHYKEAVTSRRVRTVATRRQETDCLSPHYRIIPLRNKPLQSCFHISYTQALQPNLKGAKHTAYRNSS